MLSLQPTPAPTPEPVEDTNSTGNSTEAGAPTGASTSTRRLLHGEPLQAIIPRADTRAGEFDLSENLFEKTQRRADEEALESGAVRHVCVMLPF